MNSFLNPNPDLLIHCSYQTIHCLGISCRVVQNATINVTLESSTLGHSSKHWMHENYSNGVPLELETSRFGHPARSNSSCFKTKIKRTVEKNTEVTWSKVPQRILKEIPLLGVPPNRTPYQHVSDRSYCV